jgi:hypothetical protein
MRFLVHLFLLASLALSTAVPAQAPSLPAVDFQRYFPHLVAVSEEVRDKEYPEGVQYKFLSVRDEQDHVIILALTRREGDGRVARVFLAKGPVEGSEATFRSTVTKFSDTTHMKFQIFDLRDVHTYADFASRAETLGWGVQPITK